MISKLVALQIELLNTDMCLLLTVPKDSVKDMICIQTLPAHINANRAKVIVSTSTAVAICTRSEISRRLISFGGPYASSIRRS